MNNPNGLKLFKTKVDAFESSNSNQIIHFLYVILKLYVFTNIHIALVGTLITFLFSFFLKTHLPTDFYILIFNSILSYYCLHWLLSTQKIKSVRDHWTSKNKKTLLLLSAVSALVVLSLFYKNREWLVFFVPTILSGIAYTFFANRLFKTFTPRFKAVFITLFWIYTLTIIPFLIVGLNQKNLLIFFTQVGFVFAITFIITLIFEERDIRRNEFKLTLNQLIDEKAKLIRIRNIFFILALVVSLSLIFSSVYLGLINFICVCLLYLIINTFKFKKGWIYFDLLIDSVLCLSAIGNVLFYI